MGGWCALLFLCRLEALAALPVLVVLFRRPLARDARRGLLLAAPAALCAVSYVAWCRLAFGTWGPVSGQVKWRMARNVWEHLSWSDRISGVFHLPWIGEPIVRRPDEDRSALIGRIRDEMTATLRRWRRAGPSTSPADRDTPERYGHHAR